MAADTATTVAPAPSPPATPQLPKEPPPGFGVPEKRGSLDGDRKS
jgi:hypothetical protein